MTTDSIPQPSFNSALMGHTTAPATVKFGLYVKTHEIKELERSLRQVMLMPKKQRALWLSEHEDFMNDLLDSFVSDSTLALDGLQLDDEALQLSIEFVSSLRDAMNTIRSILSEARTLSS